MLVEEMVVVFAQEFFVFVRFRYFTELSRKFNAPVDFCAEFHGRGDAGNDCMRWTKMIALDFLHVFLNKVRI